MLVLHGFSSSNYYNIVKLALLEKGVPFQEALVYSGAGPDYHPEFLLKSPLGKVPCLETDAGCISESRCILEYLERAHPDTPLYPASPFEVAKLLELTQIIDLYLELATRRLLPNFFTRTPAPENIARDVRATLHKGVKALAQLARFDDFILGDRFSAADIAALIHIPVVRNVAQRVLEHDPFESLQGLPAYLARMEQRPMVQRVRKDQLADQPAFFAHVRKGRA